MMMFVLVNPRASQWLRSKLLRPCLRQGFGHPGCQLKRFSLGVAPGFGFRLGGWPWVEAFELDVGFGDFFLPFGGFQFCGHAFGGLSNN